MIIDLDEFEYTIKKFDMFGRVRLYASLGSEPLYAKENTYLPLSTYSNDRCPYCGSDPKNDTYKPRLRCGVDSLGGWDWEEYECGVAAATRPLECNGVIVNYVLGISERTSNCVATIYIEHSASADDIV